MKVVILAAGESSRMGTTLGPVPGKAWVTVPERDGYGAPLVERTVRLAMEQIMVGPKRPLLDDALGDLRVMVREDADHEALRSSWWWWWRVAPGGTVVERILHALYSPLSEGGITFLLGDVFYSRAAIRTIFTDGTDPAFFGRKGRHPIWGRGDDGEVYALKVGPESLDLMRAEVSRLGRGKLRWLHDAIAKRHARTIGPSLWVEIADYTDDFDEPEDLTRIPEMARMAREETT